MERRLMTPAEAALLLKPSAATAAACVQAGLLSLLDAGRIRLEAANSLWKQATLVLVPEAPGAEPLPAHIESLATALSNYGKGLELSSSQVLHALQRAFGTSYRRYVHDEVGPSLIKRGLIDRSDGKWLGIFPRVTFRRTPRGEAMAAPFERLMLAIERLPAMIADDPERAIAVARSAGVLLIMSPKARRQIPALRKLLAERGADDHTLAYVAIDTGEGKSWDQLLDIGDMALQFDIGSLFDSIDAVGDFTSGGDSSGSDGGDGGGGD